MFTSSLIRRGPFRVLQSKSFRSECFWRQGGGAARALTTAIASSSHNNRREQKTGGNGFYISAAIGLSLLALNSSMSRSLAEEKRPSSAASASSDSGLDPKQFIPLKLKKVEKYNHNTSVFYFSLPNGEGVSANLPVASFVLVRATINGKEEIRPYTPIDQHEKGVLKLLIKDYPQGKVSHYIHNLKVGDTLDIEGPLPKIPYKANEKKHIGMIAGGTGITPFLQVIEEVVRNPSDNTRVTLLFANVSEKDILLKERFDALAKKHKNLNVVYIIDKPTATGAWSGMTGYITPEIIKKTMPPPVAGNHVFVCGPIPMMKMISGTKKSITDQGEVEGFLKDLGYTKDNVYKF